MFMMILKTKYMLKNCIRNIYIKTGLSNNIYKEGIRILCWMKERREILYKDL